MTPPPPRTHTGIHAHKAALYMRWGHEGLQHAYRALHALALNAPGGTCSCSPFASLNRLCMSLTHATVMLGSCCCRCDSPDIATARCRTFDRRRQLPGLSACAAVAPAPTVSGAATRGVGARAGAAGGDRGLTMQCNMEYQRMLWFCQRQVRHAVLLLLFRVPSSHVMDCVRCLVTKLQGTAPPGRIRAGWPGASSVPCIEQIATGSVWNRALGQAPSASSLF
jgi:hypothetical protein